MEAGAILSRQNGEVIVETGLKNKVVLVTGGAGGIGSEICRAFMGEGASVAVHYLTHEKQAHALASTSSCRAIAVKADLTSEHEVARMFNEIESKLGPVDTLVANAGIWVEAPVPIHKMSLEQWNKTIATNLTSMFLCFRRFFQSIEEHKLSHPSAVIIGSTAGLIGEADHSDYAASKSGAIPGLLLTLKNEMVRLAPRGRVNAVCPSWVSTPMVEAFDTDPDAIKRALQTVPLRKIGKPADVASAVVFLSSPLLAGHVTGHSMVVAGGMEGRVLFEKNEIKMGLKRS